MAARPWARFLTVTTAVAHARSHSIGLAPCKRSFSMRMPVCAPERNLYPRFALDPNTQGCWVTTEQLATAETTLMNGEKDTKLITTTGRIVSKRESSSKLVFYDVIQNGKTIQAVASRDRFEGTPEAFADCNHAVGRGDIVALTGVQGKTHKGQVSLFVTKGIQMLAPCLHDIPRAGLKDPEKRFRFRHLDMLVNPKVAEIFRVRSQTIGFLRRFFEDRGFLEVETPILSSKAGGAAARPFTTHAHALDMDMQLRIAPELYLKQLVIGGMDRVYEIGKQFRNEGVDSDHNPEFTTCEFYQAYSNLEALFNDTETMLRDLVYTIHNTKTIIHNGTEIDFQKAFQKIDVMETLENKVGSLAWIDEEGALEKLRSLARQHGADIHGALTLAQVLDKMISQWIEPICIQPTFLYNHPLALSPLAKAVANPSGCRTAARFELFVSGKEIVNAYEELNDPQEQRRRFEQQQTDRQQGDLEAPVPDVAFCDALEYGLPPTAGWGMGIDRVVQILADAPHIREVLTFPVMRPTPTTNDPQAESNNQDIE